MSFDLIERGFKKDQQNKIKTECKEFLEGKQRSKGIDFVCIKKEVKIQEGHGLSCLAR
jgi:hypothetical protein